MPGAGSHCPGAGSHGPGAGSHGPGQEHYTVGQQLANIIGLESLELKGVLVACLLVSPIHGQLAFTFDRLRPLLCNDRAPRAALLH